MRRQVRSILQAEGRCGGGGDEVVGAQLVDEA